MNKSLQADIKLLWNYLRLDEDPLRPADIMLLLGSYDIRVADFTAALYERGFAPKIIVSGGLVPASREFLGGSEAATLGHRLEALGVPESAILLEDKATNTAENIIFSYELLKAKSLDVKSIILVHKPYMTRRSYATFKKQWPGDSIDVQVASADQTFDKYNDGTLPTDLIINSIVGDLQRIREYPKLGFQIEQEIPDEVWQAWRRLVAAGYDKHLL